MTIRPAPFYESSRFEKSERGEVAGFNDGYSGREREARLSCRGGEGESAASILGLDRPPEKWR